MDISLKQIDQTTLVSVSGSVDALTAGEVASFLSAQINSGHTHIVADLSQVDFMSSAGLRAILSALKQTRQQGGDLRLAAAQPGVEKVLNMSGFTSILKFYAAVDEAVTSFKSS